ncbi:MAG: hypothetical protein V2A73_14790 [Pseudomonadota bacterium]
MTIETSVPSATREPGTYHEFNTTSSRGLTPISWRVALVGARKASTSGAKNTPTRMFARTDGEIWGVGSEIDLMVKSAFKAATKYGKSPEIWACAEDDAGASVAATYTLTVTGTATASGDVTIRIAGRTIRAGVTTDDSAIVAATALKSAIDAMAADLPVAATRTDGVVTCTAINKGVNGNDIRTPTVVDSPAGITVVAAAGVTGTGSYDVTACLDALADKQYHSVAIANHLAVDVTDLKAYTLARANPGVKAWSNGFLAEIGSLATATTLATNCNDEYESIITAEAFPNVTGEIAAQVATSVAAEEKTYKSFDGVELDLYPPPLASVYTHTEIETALAAGVTPLTINQTQDGAKIVRLVTTKTNVGGAPFENLLDISNIRTLVYRAIQQDIRQTRDFRRQSRTARTMARMKTAALDVDYQLEALGYLQNVDAHKAEYLVEQDAIVLTRANLSLPASVVPNLHQLCTVHILVIE